eukprot:gnl/MRDRNA2_/MRDRNA2_80815_c0_seq2.p1 gnl/MRDRNA2_/MRDRNA2_80815_c0~~gnl/MRDRNA2_/MRDRNA2_80815_c0_seq2.p1  ORF type:complete len:286 (-),score=25.83 gnl/MRDRNA2_/MRDRNA2_80815_c0_seq2:658-1422(-)
MYVPGLKWSSLSFVLVCFMGMLGGYDMFTDFSFLSQVNACISGEYGTEVEKLCNTDAQTISVMPNFTITCSFCLGIALLRQLVLLRKKWKDVHTAQDVLDFIDCCELLDLSVLKYAVTNGNPAGIKREGMQFDVYIARICLEATISLALQVQFMNAIYAIKITLGRAQLLASVVASFSSVLRATRDLAVAPKVRDVATGGAILWVLLYGSYVSLIVTCSSHAYVPLFSGTYFLPECASEHQLLEALMQNATSDS